MPKRKTQSISLALQGGGAHGAFTWGVLDRLADEPGLDVKAITATSAGATNAVAFAAGLAEGGSDGAKASLERYWRAVSEKGAPFSAFSWSNSPFSALPFGPFQAAMAFTSIASPYEFNPFDINPLRDALDETIDFDAVHAAPVDLFLSATNVETGRVKVFQDGEISRDAVLASACLPQTFRAVEIDGNAYWDGGYMGNPSLFPLIYAKAPRDVLMVLLNPISRLGVPRRVPQILDRLNEISFNASLIGELRAIAFVQKLLDDGMLKEPLINKYRRLTIHAIRGGQVLRDLSLQTKYDTSWTFLTGLRDQGRAEADRWLSTCARHLGTGESSVDLRQEFLED
ncbi:MAG: patatin-like phospholipase family protein [Henriciella sp.]|jgi:NTE family protein|nr:patatin-like phospholipase family protein [Henriciella sp.]MBO6693813.1 patatin-like phospholipase family protein [Henriciella sp.]